MGLILTSCSFRWLQVDLDRFHRALSQNLDAALQNLRRLLIIDRSVRLLVLLIAPGGRDLVGLLAHKVLRGCVDG